MTGITALILLNVRRNLARSMLTVVGMGLAALVMTASLTLSEGYPATAYGPYRDYSGGDVLVFADKLWVRGTDVNESDPGSWAFRFAQPDLPGPWRFFQPGLATRGGIAPRDGLLAFTWPGMAGLENALLAQPGVETVRPYFTVPATRSEFGAALEDGPAQPPTELDLVWHDTYLRAWRGGLWTDLDRYLVKGRTLDQRDEGHLVCLVDSDRARLAALDAVFPGLVPEIGSTVRVYVPGMRWDTQGVLLVDHTNPVVVDLEVVGHYSVPTREASWIDPRAGADSGPTPPETEQLYLTSPEIIVPWQTASSLLKEASGGVLEVLATAMALGVDSLARVETVVATVGAEHPDLAVVSVPRLAMVANAQWLPEPAYRVPPSEWSGAAVTAQMGEPVQISEAFNIIFFAVAALLAAANGIVLVLERQREIGILKAVGAFTRDVILMILGEIVLLATIGALMGFILAETMAVWNLISNRASLLSIVVSVGTDLAKVLGLTVSFAAAFGLAPALRTTRMTAMEVLRKE